MNIFKSITTALILVGFGYSSSVYANLEQSSSLNPISDELLRMVDAQGSDYRIQDITQIQQLILKSGLDLSNLQLNELNLSQPDQVKNKAKLQVSMLNTDGQKPYLMESIIQNLFLNLKTLEPKISMQSNTMLIQLKSIHIERIEVDMNMNGLFGLIDPIGITKSFVTSNISR